MGSQNLFKALKSLRILKIPSLYILKVARMY